MNRIVPVVGLSGPLALQAFAGGGNAVSPEALEVHQTAFGVAKQAERSVALFGEKAEAISHLCSLANEYAEPIGMAGERQAWILWPFLWRSVLSGVSPMAFQFLNLLRSLVARSRSIGFNRAREYIHSVLVAVIGLRTRGSTALTRAMASSISMGRMFRRGSWTVSGTPRGTEMLDSGLPEIVADEEDLARFLTSSNRYTVQAVKAAAFLTKSHDRETSVFRHGV